VEFDCLPIYPSIANKENEGGNRDMKKGGGKEGDFVPGIYSIEET